MADLIDRQEAIDALEREKTYCRAFREGCEPINIFEKYNNGLADGIKAIQQLPSAEPERKVGKWLFTDAAPHRVYCSVCYKTFIPNKEWIAWKEDMIPRSYCPNCGARMDGEHDG